MQLTKERIENLRHAYDNHADLVALCDMTLAHLEASKQQQVAWGGYSGVGGMDCMQDANLFMAHCAPLRSPRS